MGPPVARTCLPSVRPPRSSVHLTAPDNHLGARRERTELRGRKPDQAHRFLRRSRGVKGIVFTEFMEMVESSFGLAVTQKILDHSNVPSKGVYTSVGTYDDQELLSLV